MGIKDYIKKKYAEQKKEWVEESEFQKKLAKKRKEAYREALLKERARIATEGVRAEAEVRLKRYKERIGYVQPSAPKVIRKVILKKAVRKGRKRKGRKGKRKKILKKIIQARAPVVSKPKTDYYGDITRGLPT